MNRIDHYAMTTREEYDAATLHLIKIKDHKVTPFVVCWNLKVYEFNNAEWDWGTYCQTLVGAIRVFNDKCHEHGFEPVDEYFSMGHTEDYIAKCQAKVQKHLDDFITEVDEDIDDSCLPDPGQEREFIFRDRPGEDGPLPSDVDDDIP